MENVINLTLTVHDVNNILTSLSQLPYSQVADLIRIIQDQAEVQVKNNIEKEEIKELKK